MSMSVGATSRTTTSNAIAPATAREGLNQRDDRNDSKLNFSSMGLLRKSRANWQFALSPSMRPFGNTRQTASLPYPHDVMRNSSGPGFEQIADFGQQRFGRRRKRRRLFLRSILSEPVVGFDQQEDHESDDQKIDHTLSKAAVFDRDFDDLVAIRLCAERQRHSAQINAACNLP